MNQDNLRELIEAASVDFDPSGFLDSILRTLILSKGESAISPNNLFLSASDVESSSKGESNLNSFLRLLGFPATRNTDNIIGSNNNNLSVGEIKSRLSQADTLNYFQESSFQDLLSFDSKSISTQILEREQILSRKKSVSDHLKMISSPLSLSVSLDGDSLRRPSIFPLVVSADIPIFPLKKRVAPAFFKGDYIRGRRRLSRPFIEHIIYMRVKNFSGAATPLKEALKANIVAEISDQPSEDKNQAGEAQSTASPQSSLLSNIDNFNLLELQLVDKFVKALKSSAIKYRKIQQVNEELKKKILYIPEPKETKNEKAGQAKISKSEKKALLETVLGEQNPNIASRSLDAKRQVLLEQRAVIESFVQLLPSDVVNESDSIRRLGDIFSTNSISDDVFVSEFSGLTTFELKALDRKLALVKQEESVLLQKYELVRSGIMLYTGEVTGLSIFDIICVLFALFSVELKYLVALLNESSLDRLRETDVFFSSNASANSNLLLKDAARIVDGEEVIFVGEALSKVQQQVEQHFNLAQSFFEKAGKGGENRKREAS